MRKDPGCLLFSKMTNTMKYIIALILLIVVTTNSFSQKIDFKNRYNDLLENLGSENWSQSQEICKELLDFVEPIDSMQTEKKVLRYIYIYSTAGLLNEQKISKDEALKNVLYMRGKEMIMPGHPFRSNCYVNCIHLADGEQNTFFSGVNNNKGTKIFSFEYVKIKDSIKETKDELEGKFIVLDGELNEISVEGNMLPRFKLKFINGNYKTVEE